MSRSVDVRVTIEAPIVVVVSSKAKVRKRKSVTNLEFFGMCKTLEGTAESLMDLVDSPKESDFRRMLKIIMEENDCEASRLYLADRDEYWRRREAGRVESLKKG